MEGESVLHYPLYMLATLFFTISVSHIAVGQTLLLRLLGDSAVLTCTSSTENEIFIWADPSVTPALNIYIVSNANVQEKTGSARNEPKYDNFGIDNNYPGSVNLIIQSVEIEDEGAYQCTLSNVADDSVAYYVHVDAVPLSVSLSCTRTPPQDCPQSVGASSHFTCSCVALGAYPDTLVLSWGNVEGDSGTNPPTNSTLRSGAYDYTGTATFIPTETKKTATCTVGGYNGSWTVEEGNYTTVPPVCNLKTLYSETNSDVTLTCNCDSAFPSDGLMYSFFQDDVLIHSGDTNSVKVSVESGRDYVFGCRQCNGVNYGQESYSSVDVIITDDGTSTKPLTEKSSTYITTGSTFAITNTYTKKYDPAKASPGIIAACCIEAVFIVALVLVIICVTRGYRKVKSQRFTHQRGGNYGTDNRAYMDLQDLGNEKNRVMNTLQIPQQNVKLVSILPGQGMLQYHKVLITRAKGNQEGVVRTSSEETTLSVIKILRSEVEHNIKLGNGNNIVKVLGWCDTVPTFVIFENVYGGNLSNHLKEEFGPHKVHTYGNTEKKKFQVSEKGSFCTLPKYALHISRGIQFLHRNKFLHPGLRAQKILLDSAGNCKLYDFVSLTNANEWIRLFWNKSVPYQWMSPEFLFLENISSAGDIWSFGVLLWEIFSYGSEPYIGQTRSAVEKQIRQKKLLHLPDNCPGAIWQLIISCWEPTVEKRPKMDEITAKLSTMCNADKEYQEIK